MKKKDIILLWTLSLVLWLAIMPLRGYHFQWAMIPHSIAFAILTWWALKRYEPRAGLWRPMIPILAPWLFELVARCFISDNLYSLPITVMPLWAVISMALFYRYRKIWLLLLCAVLWLFGVTEGFKQWFEWVGFGDKPTLTVNLADYEVADSTGSFKLSQIDSEYRVLDVWHSRCGVCLKEMPKIEALRNKYKNSEKVEVISLFVALIEGETINDSYRIMKDLGCHVPVYSIGKDSPILKECDIDSYPRILILDKDRKVIFNGSLEFAKRKLKSIGTK